MRWGSGVDVNSELVTGGAFFFLFFVPPSVCLCVEKVFGGRLQETRGYTCDVQDMPQDVLSRASV